MRKNFILCIFVIAIFYSVPAYCDFDENFFKLCRQGNLEQIKKSLASNPSLINSKTPSGLTVLMAASESNSDSDVIQFLINSGANVNEKMFAGMTALLWASWKTSNPKVVEVLLYAGAHISDEADNGKRAVDYAYMNENLAGTEIIKYLEIGFSHQSSPVVLSSPDIPVKPKVASSNKIPKILRIVKLPPNKNFEKFYHN